MKITPLIYGYSQMPESMAFPDGSKKKKIPISLTFYLIQTHGFKILVDTGCTTMPGWELQEFRGPEAALKEAGITPEEITHLLITHAHHDHIEMAKLYENANIFLQKDEYEHGKKYLPQKWNLTLFEEEIEPITGIKMICIGGHSKGSCIVKIGKTIIAGDECYTRRNLTERIPTGSSFDFQKSCAFIEKYSDPAYQVLLCHEA